MSVDQTTHGFGTKIRTGTWTASTPETPPADNTFVEFGEIVDVNLPKLAVTKMNATKLNQTDRYKRRKPGFIDPGDLSFKIHFKKADYNTLLGYVTNGTELWWDTDVPEPDDATHVSNLKFHGFVAELGGTIPEDDGITVDVSICVNGKPQWTSYT